MELIYLYVRKYDELFSEQEFNFSPNYHATLKNNELFLEKTKNMFGDYYGNNITNVSMFFGKNGSGKPDFRKPAKKYADRRKIK